MKANNEGKAFLKANISEYFESAYSKHLIPIEIECRRHLARDQLNHFRRFVHYEFTSPILKELREHLPEEGFEESMGCLDYMLKYISKGLTNKMSDIIELALRERKDNIRRTPFSHDECPEQPCCCDS
jgi:hypothetical protein